MAQPLIVPVILAAESTQHLWPLARDTMPMPFMPLLDDGRSTFQATLGLLARGDFDRPVVVTSNDSRFIAAEQMQAMGISGDIVLAPEQGKPAAETAIGAMIAGDRAADAICLVLPSSHWIGDDTAFSADCQAAVDRARAGEIVSVGLPPQSGRAAGAQMAVDPSDRSGFAALREYLERPNSLAVADGELGTRLADSGSLVFGASKFQRELAALAPDMATASRAALAGACRDLDFIRLDSEAYRRAGTASLLSLLVRRTTPILVQSPTAAWQAVDAWGAIHAVRKKDGQANVLEGPVVTQGCSGSVVMSDDILTAAIGLTDMIVVTTRDAVLVAPRSEAANVEALVARLRHDGRREASEHLRVYRPWGWYQRIDIGTRFQVKRISVKPGGLLSLQRHFHRAEHWVVVTGTAEVTVDGTVSIVHENQSVHLPIGCVHRLTNPGKIPLELIEVQVGSYTGEDDIVRLEDIYARA
ncbi:mannose-1-phosphate guanylyltransferase/mannose-6-phosphate isomerase [Phreatobacter aquaticus]|uniref:mannose-1-phosphate guanylyltransferase n=1 Tax=Phreatobacter aquaticus TaxID=2570229 RepID=A0A4D7QQC8_9HYPH|nr:mannose-1-phosphate guanylyltransferase/mannose-6-phosphate isomerase [Phreatobacter aquaticus]QCK87826.1 mannose-1-phosphate guanylyltransferase/mannose-6-phosphate isomerase [Phreatobacter aquaticus]